MKMNFNLEKNINENWFLKIILIVSLMVIFIFLNFFWPVDIYMVLGSVLVGLYILIKFSVGNLKGVPFLWYSLFVFLFSFPYIFSQLLDWNSSWEGPSCVGVFLIYPFIEVALKDINSLKRFTANLLVRFFAIETGLFISIFLDDEIFHFRKSSLKFADSQSQMGFSIFGFFQILIMMFYCLFKYRQNSKLT